MACDGFDSLVEIDLFGFGWSLERSPFVGEGSVFDVWIAGGKTCYELGDVLAIDIGFGDMRDIHCVWHLKLSVVCGQLLAGCGRTIYRVLSACLLE